MSDKQEGNALRTIYRKGDPNPHSMYAIDARLAVEQHPGEWRKTPWPEDGAETNDNDEVTILPEWADQTAPKRLALAKRLGAPNNVKLTEADALIAAELDRRETRQ